MANSKRLRLYRLNPDYVMGLSKIDKNVLSTSRDEGKDTRPFVGIVIAHGDIQYCIPLSSPKPKHDHMRSSLDFSKVFDNNKKLIGVLNFNNMIPVNESVLVDLDITVRPDDSAADRAYKLLMRNQLRWCNVNRDLIRKKAAKLYRIVTERPESARGLVKRCCDFKRLEQALDLWESESPKG